MSKILGNKARAERLAGGPRGAEAYGRDLFEAWG